MADGQGLAAQGNQRERSGVTSERWKRVEALFEQVVEIPTADRPQFIEGIGDDELRREVESLLEAHDQAGPFIEEPDRFFSSERLEPDGASFLPGEIIDRYRIIREIGRGGMGAVFLAERADDAYQKQVAIKLIKRGMDTDSVLRHFRNERQILAGFDHPNIARLFDGGTTESGLPYFVMEYVEGLSIHDYCQAHALSVVERLQLFREVCAAVSYAHRHLVIHRDIKRSNILITAEGVPKLLDFGIAKILQPDAEPLATMTGMRVMTPEYASPEQARGERVTTASDVYSLGVVLYELLTGQSPYGSATPTPNDFDRVINEVQPKKPSTAIARSDGSSKSQIPNPKLLKGDLDNIVLMALRKEPERRYQSAEQFSEDIRRHLEARPVLARQDTFGYRSAKFLRRNKAALAATALVLLILIGGIIATSRQAQIATREKARAERRFNEVRKLANSVLFKYHDAIKNLPGATEVRKQLVQDALEYLDSLADDAQGDPALQRELAAAYDRVGEVRGGISHGNLGDLAGAIESYTKAFKIREALLAQNPNDPQARRDLAGSHKNIAIKLRATSEAGRSLDHFQKALAVYLDLTREQPANERLHLALVDTRNKLGEALADRGDLAGALEQCHAARELCERLVASDPRDGLRRHILILSQEQIADALFLQKDVAGAIEATDKAVALAEALIAEDPLNAASRSLLAGIYNDAGEYRRKTDARSALEYFRKAAAMEEELLAADPANAVILAKLGYTNQLIADFLADTGEFPQALSHFSKAREIFEKVIADTPGDLLSRFRLAMCGAGVGGMRARLGQPEEALKECRKSAALLGGISEDATLSRHRSFRAEVYEYLGTAYEALANQPQASASESQPHWSAARDMFRESLNILDDLRRRGILNAADAEWATEIAGEIAKCDAALGK